MGETTRAHLGKIFFGTFLVTFLLVLGVLKMFGFEVAIIFAVCLAMAVIASVGAGIENIIILNSRK